MEPRLFDGDVLTFKLGSQIKVHGEFDEGMSESDVNLAVREISSGNIFLRTILISWIPPHQVSCPKPFRLVGRDVELHTGRIRLPIKVRRIGIDHDLV